MDALGGSTVLSVDEVAISKSYKFNTGQAAKVFDNIIKSILPMARWVVRYFSGTITRMWLIEDAVLHFSTT